jgi:uncharacterized membrane protein YhhN
MALLKELAAELVGMFAGEKRLTLAVLAVVAAADCWIDFTSLNDSFSAGQCYFLVACCC